jgi:hypothetical protein
MSWASGPAGLWHLEGLVNLDALPARGALLFVGALKLEEGSGAPARGPALLSAAPPRLPRGRSDSVGGDHLP